MKITIVSGSQRANSQSLSVARYLKSLSLEHFDAADILDLHQLNLPFWNEGVWQQTEDGSNGQPFPRHLNTPDAVILITPRSGMEWRRQRSRTFCCCLPMKN
ncbi:NAD(P)H-dependent oxidoreductase [Vibrio sp. M60_M31a]